MEGVELINLAEDTDKGQAVCEHSIELWLPYNARNFLSR